MNEDFFNEDDLRKCDKQYQITIKSALSFNIGERVFLKSNPEIPMVVIDIIKDHNHIKTQWSVSSGKIGVAFFTPETILPYAYAGLVIYKDHYLSLN